MSRVSPSSASILIVGALSLAACSKLEALSDNATADAVTAENGAAVNMGGDKAMAGVPTTANFNGGDGALLGTVTISEDPNGLVMNINAVGMPAGVHGIHLHEKGVCEGPKFESAGGHWNPAGKQHGRDNPAGAHAGDLVNLTVAADGTATVSVPVAGAKVASGAMMLADADGTALVIHAKADDYKTDPSGDSGDRIACAVVAKGK